MSAVQLKKHTHASGKHLLSSFNDTNPRLQHPFQLFMMTVHESNGMIKVLEFSVARCALNDGVLICSTQEGKKGFDTPFVMWSIGIL